MSRTHPVPSALRRQRGMVTLELAVGILSVAMVLFASSSVIGMLILQDRAESIASQAARHAARGDADQLGRVRRTAPIGAKVDVTRRDGWAVATVTLRRSWGRLGPFTVTGSASAALEPGE